MDIFIAFVPRALPQGRVRDLIFWFAPSLPGALSFLAPASGTTPRGTSSNEEHGFSWVNSGPSCPHYFIAVQVNIPDFSSYSTITS